MHLWLMCHPIAHAPTNAWRPTASTLCPLSLLRKKKALQEVNLSYTQKEAQNDHPQRISYILVAVSKTTLFAFRLVGEERRKKKKEEERRRKKKTNNSNFRPFRVGHLRTVSIHYYCCSI